MTTRDGYALDTFLLNRAFKDDEDELRRGKPVAALVPIEDLNLLEAIENQLDAEEFARAKEASERSGEPTIPWEKIKAELDL